MVHDQLKVHNQELQHTNYQLDIDIVYDRRFLELNNQVYHKRLYSYPESKKKFGI